MTPEQKTPPSWTANFGWRLLDLTTARKSSIVTFRFPSVGAFNSKISPALIYGCSLLSTPANGFRQFGRFLNICPSSKVFLYPLGTELPRMKLRRWRFRMSHARISKHYISVGTLRANYSSQSAANVQISYVAISISTIYTTRTCTLSPNADASILSLSDIRFP